MSELRNPEAQANAFELERKRILDQIKPEKREQILSFLEEKLASGQLKTDSEEHALCVSVFEKFTRLKELFESQKDLLQSSLEFANNIIEQSREGRDRLLSDQIDVSEEDKTMEGDLQTELNGVLSQIKEIRNSFTTEEISYVSQITKKMPSAA